MKKKNNIGLIGAGVAALMGMAGLIAEAATPIVVGETKQEAGKNVKSSISGSIPRVVRESKRNSHGQSEWRYKKKGFLNQEEKRRKLRSNPHFRNSKKCTTKIK